MGYIVIVVLVRFVFFFHSEKKGLYRVVDVNFFLFLHFFGGLAKSRWTNWGTTIGHGCVSFLWGFGCVD